MAPGSPANDGRDALFADIAALTGMPFPNLLYRRLAENPRQLEDCWSRVRPGLARIGPARLRLLMLDGVQPPGPHVETDPGSTSSLRSFAQHSPGDLFPDSAQAATLLRVLDAYDSGNSCNIVVIALLLEGSKADRSSPLVYGRATHDPRNARPESGVLPPMLDLEAMSSDAVASVLRLSRVIEPRGRAIPSLFRHLGHDPVLLRWVEAELGHSSDSGALDQAETSMRASAAWTASHWPEAVQPLADEPLRNLLDPFRTMIPRMLAVSAVLRRAVEGQLP